MVESFMYNTHQSPFQMQNYKYLVPFNIGTTTIMSLWESSTVKITMWHANDDDHFNMTTMIKLF